MLSRHTFAGFGAGFGAGRGAGRGTEFNAVGATACADILTSCFSAFEVEALQYEILSQLI